MYTVANEKWILLFSGIRSSYLVCWNKLKFPSANEISCAQGFIDISMAELPTMPFRPHTGGGGFLPADFSKTAVADFSKIYKPGGGLSACTFPDYSFVSSTDFV